MQIFCKESDHRGDGHTIKYTRKRRNIFLSIFILRYARRKMSPFLREYGKERGAMRAVKRWIKLLYSHWNKCNKLVTAPWSVPHIFAHTFAHTQYYSARGANLTYRINSSFSLLLRLYRVIYISMLYAGLYTAWLRHLFNCIYIHLQSAAYIKYTLTVHNAINKWLQ